MQRKTEGEIDT